MQITDHLQIHFSLTLLCLASELRTTTWDPRPTAALSDAAQDEGVNYRPSFVMASAWYKEKFSEMRLFFVLWLTEIWPSWLSSFLHCPAGSLIVLGHQHPHRYHATPPVSGTFTSSNSTRRWPAGEDLVRTKQNIRRNTLCFFVGQETIINTTNQDARSADQRPEGVKIQIVVLLLRPNNRYIHWPFMPDQLIENNSSSRVAEFDWQVVCQEVEKNDGGDDERWEC